MAYRSGLVHCYSARGYGGSISILPQKATNAKVSGYNIMNLIEHHLPIGAARSGKSLVGLTSITIHWIGAFPGQSVYDPYNYWLQSGKQLSAHYIVKGNTVLWAVPIEEVAWHAGCKEGNYTSIGIEVIPANIAGMFGPETLVTLKELLGTLPAMPLKRHYDWTEKDCPRYYTPYVEGGDARWTELVRILRS